MKKHNPNHTAEMLDALKGLGTLMFQAMNAGAPAGVEQSDIFASARKAVAQGWGATDLQAANLCRLALNEATRHYMGRDHYTPSDLCKIVDLAFN